MAVAMADYVAVSTAGMYTLKVCMKDTLSIL